MTQIPIIYNLGKMTNSTLSQCHPGIITLEQYVFIYITNSIANLSILASIALFVKN